MALIKHGSLSDFSVAANSNKIARGRNVANITNFRELSEVSKGLEPNSFELITSEDARGLCIAKLKLEEGFNGFLNNLFNATNHIYFIAWAWDFSGQPVNLYPGAGVASEDILIPIKVGKIREFIGDGIILFPKRKVTGGLAVRIQIWESDQEIRNLGKTLSAASQAVKESKLNNLLSLISLGTGVSGVTISLVKDAAIELTGIIGTILQANNDDYVDFFEGYYASDKPWKQEKEVYKGNSSELTLQKL